MTHKNLPEYRLLGRMKLSIQNKPLPFDTTTGSACIVFAYLIFQNILQAKSPAAFPY